MNRPRSARGRVAGGRLTGHRMAGGRVATGRVAGRGLTTGRMAGRLAPLCAAAALALVMLAACGTSQVPGAGPGASPSPTVAATVAGSSGAAIPGTTATQLALCRHTASVTGLEIVRNDVVRVPVLQLAAPNQITVASPARARAVARALCALPLMPRGIFNCPNLVAGTTYLLRFTAGGRRLPAVTVEATGCEVVTGVGPARRAATSPGFWLVLGTAAHLRPPGRSAFSGGGHPRPSCDSSRREQANGCPALIQPAG
jgi:hypothetical protein